VPVALTQEVGRRPPSVGGILGIRTRRITLMIVTDVYPGKDLGTLELTITVFWSCRVSRSVARRTNRYCWRKR